MGAKVFGADGVKNVLLHAKERKAAGEKYCDCPACAACEALLAKKEGDFNRINCGAVIRCRGHVAKRTWNIRLTIKKKSGAGHSMFVSEG